MKKLFTILTTVLTAIWLIIAICIIGPSIVFSGDGYNYLSDSPYQITMPQTGAIVMPGKMPMYYERSGTGDIYITDPNGVLDNDSRMDSIMRDNAAEVIGRDAAGLLFPSN